MGFGIGDLISGVAGGPLGFLGYQGYKQQQEGNDAANAGMAQAQAALGDLQKTQRNQRQADLQRALAYFGPTNDLMKRMYGTALPAPYITDAQHDATRAATMGKARFGGNAPIDPASMFGPPAPAVDPNKYAAQQQQVTRPRESLGKGIYP